MRKLLKNKKAQTEFTVTFLYRFLIILLVVGIFTGVIWYTFSKQVDVRQLESSVIASKITSCMTDKRVLSQDSFSVERIKGCLEIDEQEIFMNLSFKNKNVGLGNEDLKIYCETEEKKVQGKYLPSCFNETYYVLDSENKLEQLGIFIALDKHEKNV
jgi:hypothetical protein